MSSTYMTFNTNYSQQSNMRGFDKWYHLIYILTRNASFYTFWKRDVFERKFSYCFVKAMFAVYQ